MKVESSLAGILKGHCLFHIAERLGSYLETGCDSVALTLFLSRVAGRVGLPVNVVIKSDIPGAELLIADRILSIDRNTVARVDRIGQFRELANHRFHGVDVVLLRTVHEPLHRYSIEVACMDTQLKRDAMAYNLEMRPCAEFPRKARVELPNRVLTDEYLDEVFGSASRTEETEVRHTRREAI